MKPAIEAMLTRTDCYPWYWYSYGEKCYAFGVVEAIPQNEFDEPPEPGTRLTLIDGKLFGVNGTEMCTMDGIAQIERQNGDVICEFIAKAHNELVMHAD